MSSIEQQKPREIVSMQDDLKSAHAAGLVEPTRPTIAMTQKLPKAKGLESLRKNTDTGPKFRPNPINGGNSLTQPVESGLDSNNKLLWIAGIILAIILLAIITTIIRS